jgi:hypothetical protein
MQDTELYRYLLGIEAPCLDGGTSGVGCEEPKGGCVGDP